jgi:hypothetical protein
MYNLPPSPWVYHKGRFDFFRKFGEIFVAQGAPLVSTTPAANFATGTVGVVDTGGKFATGVTDTGGIFAAGVNDPDEYLHKYLKKFETALMVNSGNWGKLIS